MSTITKELAKLFRKITNSEIDAEGNAHVVLSPADSLLINNARIALASLEAEPVAWLLSGGGAKNNVSFDSGNAYADPLREVTPLYTAPPAPVSVPAAMEIDDDFDSAFEHGKAVGWNAYRAAMLQAEPVSNSDELPLDYLQGHKDGLEWAAQLSESNHPETGDWLYDDPIELAKAIRKGPDMPPAQPVADSEPVTLYRQVNPVNGMKTYWAELDPEEFRHLKQYTDENAEFMTLYRHAQPVVPDDVQRDAKRWRALLGSARIRILGSAGFDATAHPGENPDYRHFGMEIWTHYPNWLHEKNEYGIDTLTQYADAMLAAAPQEVK